MTPIVNLTPECFTAPIFPWALLSRGLGWAAQGTDLTEMRKERENISCFNCWKTHVQHEGLEGPCSPLTLCRHLLSQLTACPPPAP